MITAASQPIVVRSEVQEGLAYQRYREYLRFDFWYSCAYCSISEVEAQGIGFEIDHFEPQSVCQGDVHGYANLMWACSTCNGNKSNIWPSPRHLSEGYRYVRPDREDPSEHFRYVAYLLYPKTNAGQWTIQVLFLNSDVLKRLRRLRERIFGAQKAIAHGIQSLQHVRLDRLKPEGRQRFLAAKASIVAQNKNLTEEDLSCAVVRVFNHSPLLDSDPNVRFRTKRRREYLESLKVLIAKNGELDEGNEGVGVDFSVG